MGVGLAVGPGGGVNGVRWSKEGLVSATDSARYLTLHRDLPTGTQIGPTENSHDPTTQDQSLRAPHQLESAPPSPQSDL